jgi:hypothetical protein
MLLSVFFIQAAGMDERTLLESVDRVAHGLEVVQSIFPG